jgi:hypothetical protein
LINDTEEINIFSIQNKDMLMNKTIAMSLFAASLVSLSGCETSSQAYNMSQQGTAAFSCVEISKAFSAYEADRQSASGLMVLAPLISADVGSMSQSISTGSDAYYNQAKSSVNTALLLQGCQMIN